MILYHAAPIALGPDSIILPGNWRRLIHLGSEGHPFWTRETMFEAIRQERFPHKPSRLSACFACPDEPTLRRYVGTHSPLSVLYEVEMVEPGAACHVTDWAFVTAKGATDDEIQLAADRYWHPGFSAATAIRNPEVVTPSPLRVIRAL